MMEKCYIVGISGSHGSGKSTLIQDLSKKLLEEKIQFEVSNLSLSETSKRFSNFQKLRVNQANSYNYFKNQYYCGQTISRLVDNLEILDALTPQQLLGNKKILYITDRTPLDQLAYTIYFYLYNKYKNDHDYTYYSDQDNYISKEYLKQSVTIMDDKYKYSDSFGGSEEQLLIEHMEEVLDFCNSIYDQLIIPDPLNLDSIENNTGFRDHQNKLYQEIVNIIYWKLQNKLSIDKFNVTGSREERQSRTLEYIKFKFDKKMTVN